MDSIGRTERSALKVLREQLFAHKSDLISAFKQYDSQNTGVCRVPSSPFPADQVMPDFQLVSLCPCTLFGHLSLCVYVFDQRF